MVSDIFWQHTQALQNTTLHCANHHWILDYEVNGQSHFEDFEKYLTECGKQLEFNLGAPPQPNSPLADKRKWVESVLKGYSDLNGFPNSKQTAACHLGAVQWDAHRDPSGQLTISSLQTLYKITLLEIEIFTRSTIIADVNTLYKPLANALNSKDIDKIKDECHTFNLEVTTLLSNRLNEMKQAVIDTQQNSHKTALNDGDKTLPELTTPGLCRLWVTPWENLVIKIESAITTDVRLQDLFYLESFFATLACHDKIRDLTGVYDPPLSKYQYNPLSWTCCLLNFTIPATSDLLLVKSGFFNNGNPALWAYANASDNAGRTVQLADGREGVPEAITNFQECIAHLDQTKAENNAFFVLPSQRERNIPSVELIESIRSQENDDR